MNTSGLKKFAQAARTSLMGQVSAKMGSVLAEGSAARREAPKAVEDLEKQVRAMGESQLIERVAYIWFNRLSALRFMDANGYNKIRIVSPADGRTRPEILSEAAGGYIDNQIVPQADADKVAALLDGRLPSHDPQAEAYRLLLVAACNHWHKAMPFLFEKIADYTELLMPDGLLAANSVLAQMRDVMTEDACQDVEVIGWLYQFYISEKKDEVFAGLKKNKKVTPENIPAATQLFTPHWIVRYLVENSLGRLWMLNHPGSKLVDQMEYYIAPVEAEDDFLRIANPEEIKVCDPACGSGHMLTYAFDLLYAIYEEEGYDAADIPAKILTNNLFGIEIDERAGELAAFALTMKAASRRKRFLRDPVQSNICVLENVIFKDGELAEYMDAMGRDLFTTPLQTTLGQFEEADNFGSLIQPALTDVTPALDSIAAKDLSGQLFLHPTHKRVLTALKQADYLSPKYHVVVANPPYMGGKGMNGMLGDFLREHFPRVKSDLFAAFMLRNVDLAKHGAYLGFMTPFVWMFIGNFQSLRETILRDFQLQSLVRPEYHAFFESAYVPICAFCLSKQSPGSQSSVFIDLQDFYGADVQAPKFLEAINDTEVPWRFDFKQERFESIPGSPLSFSLPEPLIDAFDKFPSASSLCNAKKGTTTGNNGLYLRFYWECSRENIGHSGQEDGKRFFPHAKGGDARKWFGNLEYVMGYDRTFISLMGKEKGFRHDGKDFFFKEGLSWSGISSDVTAFRYSPKGLTFNNAAPTAFFDDREAMFEVLLAVNSKVARPIIQTLNPTLNFNPGDFGRIPIAPLDTVKADIASLGSSLIETARSDWDSYETSWDFTGVPLMLSEHRNTTLAATYTSIRSYWQGLTDEMLRLEEENNRIFIDAYGLQGELTPDVPLEEITLTCNPAYRYGGKNTEPELEDKLRADTMREFLSYAVGCMFGRYSIDKPGLILANQGETVEDYRRLVPNSSFEADDDNVIPMLDGDWFPDDITERFRKFLRVTFGEEHFAENLKFIEDAIGKDIRKFFLKDFYADHVKRYKTRPIYWLFSSPKGSFNALIYMHRYRPDTISVILNDYLREYRTKLTAQKEQLEKTGISADASASAKVKAQKDIDNFAKIITELDDYERDVLYPMATKKLEIDLDDGVKVNYAKFGKALKTIPGLSK